MTEDNSERKAYLFKTLCFNIGLNKFDTKGFALTGLPALTASSSGSDAATKEYVDNEVKKKRSNPDEISLESLRQQVEMLTKQIKLPQYRELVIEMSAKKTSMGFAAPIRLTDVCSHALAEGGLYSSITLLTLATRVNLMNSNNKELHASDNSSRKDLGDTITIRLKGKKSSGILGTFQTKKVSQRFTPPEPIIVDASFTDRIEITPSNFNKVFSMDGRSSTVRVVTDKADSIRLIMVFVVDVVYKFNLPHVDDEM